MVRRLWPVCLLLFAPLLAASLLAFRQPPALAATAPGPAGAGKNVLILFPFNQDFPVHAQLAKGFRQRLLEAEVPVAISYEYLDMNRFADESGYLAEVARFFQAKYAVVKPDVVVSGGPLGEFLGAYGQAMFPGVPVVFPDEGGAALQAGPGGREGLSERAKSIEIIFRSLPSTRTVYVVLGDSEEERALGGAMDEAAAPWKDRARFVFTSDLPYGRMLSLLAGADKDSAVLFMRWLRDAGGAAFTPDDVLREVCRRSAAPVFGVVSHSLGEGIVGGYLFSFERFGRRLADQALLALGEGEAPGPASALPPGEYAFDWRQLSRWGIPAQSLPPGSRIEFRAPSLLDEHGAYILGGLAVFLLEAVLIAALAVNRSRRRSVEAQLKRVNESLEEAVAERTRELGEANAQLVRAKGLLEGLNARLDLASRTDCMTGLRNRRHMEEVFLAGHAMSLRTGEPFSMALCDIDLFKTVNDRFGHDAGDALLKLLARDLAGLVRPYDTLSRWGGEEFLLFMPSTGTEGALTAAERIREVIQARAYPCGAGDHRVTVTLGVATWRPGDSVDDVLKRADQALYEGKRAGRNRVVAA